MGQAAVPLQLAALRPQSITQAGARKRRQQLLRRTRTRSVAATVAVDRVAVCLWTAGSSARCLAVDTCARIAAPLAAVLVSPSAPALLARPASGVMSAARVVHARRVISVGRSTTASAATIEPPKTQAVARALPPATALKAACSSCCVFVMSRLPSPFPRGPPPLLAEVLPAAALMSLSVLFVCALTDNQGHMAVPSDVVVRDLF